jgi:hypothetical protein
LLLFLDSTSLTDYPRRYLRFYDSPAGRAQQVVVRSYLAMEGIYKGKSSTLLRGIHIKLTYTKDKELGMFLGRCPLWDP